MVSSWTKSSIALKQLLEQQKPAGCKSGLGFAEGESPESSSKMNKIKDKNYFIKFVKNCSNNTQTDDKTLEIKVKNPLAVYVKPFDQQSSWLKPNSRANSCFEKYPAEGKSKTFYKQKGFSKIKLISRKKIAKIFKSLKTITGRSIKIIQVWIPKGLIDHGPI